MIRLLRESDGEIFLGAHIAGGPEGLDYLDQTTRIRRQRIAYQEMNLESDLMQLCIT